MGTIDWTCQNLVFSFSEKEQLEGGRGLRYTLLVMFLILYVRGLIK
jgi:hypothetical protein